MSSDKSAATVAKICCQCGADVSHSRRLKDSRGYWCVPCNEADKLHQLCADAGMCESCGAGVGATQLTKIGGQSLCPHCRDRRSKFRTISKTSDGTSIVEKIKSLFGK